jgi:hypothetical protein
MTMDFGDAGPQRSFDLIPDQTVVPVHMEIRPGGAGEGGWLKRSKDGGSEALDCEFTIISGPYKDRKFWERFLIAGTTSGHQEAAEITRKRIKAILESARGVKPDDKSEAAAQARRITTFADMDGMRFWARLTIEPAKDGFKAKNVILSIVTPEQSDWRKLDQVAAAAKPQARPSTLPTSTPKPSWAQ